MITKAEILDIAKLKTKTNLGYVEKDYLLELVLFSISRNTKQELIFKGGTALYKFYKFERFSEDLDFSEIETLNISNLIKRVILDLSKFRIESSVLRIKEPFNSILLTLRIKGPLYNGKLQTLSTIRIDINKKSAVELQPSRLKFVSLYTEIPSFYVSVMQEKEILAEKIRDIITRNKARDLFDTFVLIEKGIEIDKELLKKKLAYYDIEFNKKRLIESINKKQNLWIKELKPFLKELPSFIYIKKKILSVV